MTFRMAAEQAARTCVGILTSGCAIVKDENDEYATCICDKEASVELRALAWIPGKQPSIAGGVRELYRQVRQTLESEAPCLTLNQAIADAARMAKYCNEFGIGYGVCRHTDKKGYYVRRLSYEHRHIWNELAWVPSSVKSIRQAQIMLKQQIRDLCGRV